LKLEFRGASVTRDAGLIAYREIEEMLSLTDMSDDLIEDRRVGKNTQHDLVGLFRQSIYSRLAGYVDTNDAERLRRDPAIRQMAGTRRKDHNTASTSQMGRFETDILAQKANLQALRDLPGLWIDQVREDKPFDKLILDLDSSVSPTHGRQEGSSYNGHFACTCYRPQFCFNQHGDAEGCMLREGHDHSADQWRSLLEPFVDRDRDGEISKFFRGGAFANPDIYEFLEEEEVFYAFRIPAHDVLYNGIAHRPSAMCRLRRDERCGGVQSAIKCRSARLSNQLYARPRRTDGSWRPKWLATWSDRAVKCRRRDLAGRGQWSIWDMSDLRRPD
jgi:hypothetical protein